MKTQKRRFDFDIEMKKKNFKCKLESSQSVIASKVEEIKCRDNLIHMLKNRATQVTSDLKHSTEKVKNLEKDEKQYMKIIRQKALTYDKMMYEEYMYRTKLLNAKTANSNHNNDGAGISELVRDVINNGSRKYLSSKKKRERSYSRSRRRRIRRRFRQCCESLDDSDSSEDDDSSSDDSSSDDSSSDDSSSDDSSSDDSSYISKKRHKNRNHSRKGENRNDRSRDCPRSVPSNIYLTDSCSY